MRCHWTSSLERRRGARSWDRSSKKKKKNEIFSSSNGFLIFLRFSFVRLTFFYPQWEVRNDMSISSVPFGFVLFFPGRAGSTFLLGSHELHTPRTNRLVVFHLFFSARIRNFLVFVSSVATPPVVASWSHEEPIINNQKKKERTRLFFVVFHLFNFFFFTTPRRCKSPLLLYPGVLRSSEKHLNSSLVLLSLIIPNTTWIHR